MNWRRRRKFTHNYSIDVQPSKGTGKNRLFNKEQKDNNDREEKEKKDKKDKEKEALYQQYGKKGKGLIRKSTILLWKRKWMWLLMWGINIVR